MGISLAYDTPWGYCRLREEQYPAGYLRRKQMEKRMLRRRGGVGGKVVGIVVVLVVLLLVGGVVIGNMGGGVDPALIESCLPLRDSAQLDRCIAEGAVR